MCTVPYGGGDEHYAVAIGTPDRATPVLTRLHSACFTGDILGSLKCDCGPQLKGALAQMGHEGAGVLLYLNQEGRGIGLANKMRAYALQDQGFDTVEANHRLGFEDDERDFQIGAELLKSLGFSEIRLMTNNPSKVARLQDQGLKVVERVPLIVGATTQNRSYLQTRLKNLGIFCECSGYSLLCWTIAIPRSVYSRDLWTWWDHGSQGGGRWGNAAGNTFDCGPVLPSGPGGFTFRLGPAYIPWGSVVR